LSQSDPNLKKKKHLPSSSAGITVSMKEGAAASGSKLRNKIRIKY
jgi:hypothetical protein